MADIAELFETVNTGVIALRERVTALESRPDAVTRDEIERLNRSIGDAQAQLDAMARPAVPPAAASPGAGVLRDFVAGKLSIGEIRANMTTFVGPDGGFLVPTEVDTAVNRVLSETSAIRRIAQVVTIGSNSFTRAIVSEGGAARWAAEASNLGNSAGPKLVQRTYRTGRMEAQIPVSMELVQDAIVSIEDWIARELAISFADLEAAAFVSGDGVDKPRGFLTYPVAVNSPTLPFDTVGVIRTGVAGAFAAAPNGGDVLVDTFYALREGYRVNATWVASDATMSAIRKLKSSDGVFLWQPGIAADQPPTILGRPAVTDNFMPAIANNSLSVAFGDFSQAYTIVDRVGIQLMQNPYRQMGMVFMEAMRRVGGDMNVTPALKLVQFSA